MSLISSSDYLSPGIRWEWLSILLLALFALTIALTIVTCVVALVRRSRGCGSAIMAPVTLTIGALLSKNCARCIPCPLDIPLCSTCEQVCPDWVVPLVALVAHAVAFAWLVRALRRLHGTPHSVEARPLG